MSEKTRAYIYRVSLALFAVAVAYKLIEQDDVPVLVDVVAAVLGIGNAGLATANTSTKP